MPNSNAPVCFLLGAGASRPAGVPTMPEMGEEFYQRFALPSLREFFQSIDSEISKAGYHWAAKDRNIEVLLKFLQSRSESLKDKGLIPFVNGEVEEQAIRRQVTARTSAIVAHELKKFVLAKVTQRVEPKYLSPLCDFMLSDRPLDIFSLNYDSVIEQFCRVAGVPCTDGFDARGNWHPESYFLARKGIRLWKLHGSADWVSGLSGWPQRSETPGTWRRHLRSGHTASATAEAALVWPAAEKELKDALLLLHDGFRQVLIGSRVLIAVGYRFADEQIAAAVLYGMEANPELEVFVLCGSRQNSEEAKSQLLAGKPSYESRVNIVEPGYIPDAFHSEALRSVLSHATLRPNAFPKPSASRRNEVLCLGNFSAMAKTASSLILTRGNPRTQLLRLDLATTQLSVIQSWRGWARGLTVAGNQAVVADCSRAGWKAGWGLIWRIDIDTGSMTNVLHSSMLDFGKAAYKTARYRTGLGAAADFLEYGMVSWPTSADTVPSEDAVLITEARRLIMLDLCSLKARSLTEPQFFNLVAVRAVSPSRCILLEHVLGQEGVLWDFDYETGVLTPVLAGIRNATGLLLTPDCAEALISEGGDAPNGNVWRVDLKRKTTSVFVPGLHRPGGMSMLGTDAIAVATAGAVIRIQL